ncbi:hypothetical protein psyc5s11_06930 [Clostridium gelidum]|uniref:ABC-2 family transporter protein n=1 Tax=Clostridium gelidum TaxID=704125 RepID=A0ABN6IVA6_9CLOT|nr:ABC transporter permease [Clostridium gelidum]BCZ44626.1 hypothetical protein psyc5s11_06930 [Clostridium gelidum]
MSNLIRGEFYKLRKSKCLIGMIFLAICAGFLLIGEWENEGRRMFSGINGVNSISLAIGMIVICNFLFSILSVAFIVNDFKNGGISKSYSYGFRRSEVILSKLIVFMLFSLVLELIYTTILVIYVSYNYGFCEVFNFNTILYLIRVISVGGMYNLATISIITMIAIITKNNLCTFVSPIILLMTFSLACSSYPYISHAFLYLPYMTGIRAINIFSSEADIIRCIISSIVTFIITIGGSLLYIKYEDIK